MKQDPNAIHKCDVPRIEEARDHVFTYQYVQPEAYRFCQDSVIFPKFVADQLNGLDIGPEFRALDIGAGCGVIGLELAHYVPALRNFDFLEIQADFQTYFEQNREIVGRNQDPFRFLRMNYADLLSEEFRESYDLVVSNPPYFMPGEGKLSPFEMKNRCRFFLDSDLPTLVRAISRILKPQGQAFVLTKTGERHGRDTLRDIRLLLVGVAEVTLVADIRGTGVFKIYR